MVTPAMGLKIGRLGALLVVLALLQFLQAADNIYSNGPLEVVLLNAKGPLFPKSQDCQKTSTGPTASGQQPPRDLFIAVPKTSGQYPVIQLQHAFTMETSFYSQLLQHVASYGYIIVAPQMNQLSLPDATSEIAGAAAVIDWHQNNLAATIKSLLPSVTIKPDLAKFVLLGHSRGGKVAFGLAAGVCKSSVKYSAVVGFDPVDGIGTGQQTPPPILPNKPAGLNLSFPTLVVGAGLGSSTKDVVLPPCAPLGVSHDAFFLDSKPLAFHFVAPEYGHMDYLDDKTEGLAGLISYAICENGPSRAPMRQFSGGILVAFLKAVLYQDYSAISNALANPSEAPVQLDDPQMSGTLPVTKYSFALPSSGTVTQLR